MPWREGNPGPGRPIRGGVGGQPQQPPPQQPPPPPPLPLAGAEDAEPPTDTVDSSFTVSSCPCGQGAGAPDWAIGRRSSKVKPHSLQRYS